MSQRAIGFVLLALGVAAFAGGLFGLAGEQSIVVFLVGGALLVFGVATLLWTLRRESIARPRMLVICLALVAAALHIYQAVWTPSGEPTSPTFIVGLTLWSMTPYFLCILVASISKSSAPATAGATIALCSDLWTHYLVFVAPTSSTAGLALMFTPLWNLLIFSPIAMGLVCLLLRRRAQLNASAP